MGKSDEFSVLRFYPFLSSISPTFLLVVKKIGQTILWVFVSKEYGENPEIATQHGILAFATESNTQYNANR